MTILNNIFVIPIEPIDQRYSKQWYDNIPEIIRGATDRFNVVTVEGGITTNTTTKGAFLDFAFTNEYKASQVERISQLFQKDLIKPGDKFLFTDAWHFGIIAVKYMSELLDVPVQIHSIWHAGSYDSTDILGMKVTRNWSRPFEQSLYNASDYNYFATDFHKVMFLRNSDYGWCDEHKAIRSGQPHDYIIAGLLERQNTRKENIIIFPHRLNSDKQPEIFEDLSLTMAYYLEYSSEMTQKLNLSKKKYYDKLGTAKVVFSCALHENLGISVMEGCLAGAIPIVPDRASYSEMYLNCFKYPSEWTESWDAYKQHASDLCNFIQERVDNYDKYFGDIITQQAILMKDYLRATEMINRLIA